MKKLLLFFLTFSLSFYSFSLANTIDALQLMGLTEKQIIDRFGFPREIVTLNTNSIRVCTSRNSYDFRSLEYTKYNYLSINDIEFLYDGFSIKFYNPNNSYLFSKTHSCNFRVCSIKLENSDYIKLPYNLDWNDKLADIFQKLGNPDKYEKSLISYSKEITDDYIGLSFINAYNEYRDIISTENIDIYFDSNNSFSRIEVSRNFIIELGK